MDDATDAIRESINNGKVTFLNKYRKCCLLINCLRTKISMGMLDEYRLLLDTVLQSTSIHSTNSSQKTEEPDEEFPEQYKPKVMIINQTKTGQGIAATLAWEVKSRCNKVFFDASGTLSLAKLRDQLKQTKYLIFVVTEGVLQDEQCFQRM